MMHSRRGCWRAGIAAVLMIGALAPQALATDMKACSVKYKAAKTAGTLNGESWKAFRAAECGSGATPATTAAPAVVAPAVVAPAARTARSAPVAVAAPVGDATFPSAVSTKYASLKPGKARMQTCLDQYHVNKADGGNGGLKWIQKGGGYYSECSKRLKTS